MPRKKRETLLQLALRRAAAAAFIALSTALGGFAVGEALNIIAVGNWLFALLVSTGIGFVGRFLQVVGEGLTRGEENVR